MRDFLFKEIKIIGVAVAAGIVLTTGVALSTRYYAMQAQQDIADSVIRFHVRANSDAPHDQALKMAVKNNVLKNFGPGLRDVQSVEEMRAHFEANMDKIQALAQEEILARGYLHTAKAYLTEAFFPTKNYGDIYFPAGRYEALRIDIGRAGGNNWWCVMFPPLCYIDVTQSEVSQDTRTHLQQLLSDDGYALITQRHNDPEIKVRFKIIEWWQERTYEQEPPQTFFQLSS